MRRGITTGQVLSRATFAAGRAHRARWCAVAIAGALAIAGAAGAAVVTDSPTAQNRASNGASNGAVATVTGGDFSLFAWIRPSNLSAPESSFFEVEGGVQVHLLQGGNVRVRLLRNSGTPLTATANAGLQTNEWMLLACSFQQANGRLDVWAISESQPLTHATAVSAGFVVGPAGNVSIGAFGGAPAMRGVYGATALRDHAVSQSDVLDLWNSRLHLGAYSIDNLSSGGSMNGPSGCIYMINHAVTTKPINHAFGTDTERAAVIGESSTQHNFHIFDRNGPSGTSLRVVRFLSSANGFTYCSVYDPPPGAQEPDGFFIKPLPALSQPLSEPHFVSGESPKLRKVAKGQPSGLMRVMTSANSRAVIASDGTETGTSNYAHGFIALNEDKVAGILNRTAQLGNNLPWFGFDTNEHGAFSQGPIEPIRFHNFSRFWTGSLNSGSHGPGEGLHLSPGESGLSATYALRCKPEGMIQANQPLVVQAYVLRYPGASNVTWVPNIHSRQGEAGTDVGTPTTIVLDTQQWTHTLSAAAGDSVAPGGFRITLGGNHTSAVSINDAVKVGATINVVSNVTYSTSLDETRIDFERAFDELPVMGDLLRFGSWDFEVIEHVWPGVDPQSGNVWRGLRISSGFAGDGVVLFAFSAWRPNVANGFLIGTAGWAGRGYAFQLARTYTAAMHGWIQILQPDVWLQMFAQQQSQPLHMSAYADEIKAALPDTEIAWLGDYEHDTGGTQEEWHRYILENAADENVIAASALMHERIGNFAALLDDGLRSDADHINQRGNTRLAQVWSELLLQAAIDPNEHIVGDIDGNGVVNVFDLLALLGAWGPCANVADCPADLDGNGVVDVFDLLLLLGHWG